MRADWPDNPVLIGDSPRLGEIRRLIEKLGRSECAVLLLGETGTGKEVVARAIHQVQARGPFVPIDCSALVGTLLETELFGHTKGAFTGAVACKPGLLEAADGGTAFFDEIGELPVRLQGKLLRVIQEQEIRPVGAVTRRRARFRVIAATNRDLAREVERGRFRRDLYYRLNVVTVRLPPLRDHMEDIPALIEHFLQRHGSHHRISPPVTEVLQDYDWPGNVRELENCIARMVAVNSGPVLHSGDLPTALQNRLAVPAAPAASAPSLPAPIVPPPSTGIVPLAVTERQAIQAALTFTHGDRVQAAQLLGIGRTTLYRRLKQYRRAPLERKGPA